MDGLFPQLATRWLSLENKRGEKSIAELYLCGVGVMYGCTQGRIRQRTLVSS